MLPGLLGALCATCRRSVRRLQSLHSHAHITASVIAGTRCA